MWKMPMVRSELYKYLYRISQGSDDGQLARHSTVQRASPLTMGTFHKVIMHLKANNKFPMRVMCKKKKNLLLSANVKVTGVNAERKVEQSLLKKRCICDYNFNVTIFFLFFFVILKSNQLNGPMQHGRG